MRGKSMLIFELMLLSSVLGRTLAKIGTQDRSMNSLGPTKLNSLGDVKLQNVPQIRFSRSPANQIRFGRSQPFVRFGRDGETAPIATDKFIRFARNGLDDNIRTRQQGQESKFIRFGRSQKGAVGPVKSDDGRSSLWWNFYRLARNPNAHIRFAGKRDGGNSNTVHHTAIPIEMLIEKFAHEQQQQPQQPQHASMRDAQDTEHSLANEDDEEIDDIDNSDQFQSNSYSNGNDLE